jgi:hypothetical protein
MIDQISNLQKLFNHLRVYGMYCIANSKTELLETHVHKRLPWCLVELLPLKVPIPCFDLELFILVVLCSMLKDGGIQF